MKLNIDLVSLTIKSARRRGVSIVRMSGILGVTPQTIYGWERRLRAPSTRMRGAFLTLCDEVGLKGYVRDGWRVANAADVLELRRVDELCRHFGVDIATIRRWRVRGVPSRYRDKAEELMVDDGYAVRFIERALSGGRGVSFSRLCERGRALGIGATQLWRAGQGRVRVENGVWVLGRESDDPVDDIIRKVLGRRARPAYVVMGECEGYGKRRVRERAKYLGIKAYRRGFGGPVMWELP